MIANPPATFKVPTVVHVLNGFGVGGVENLCLQLLKHSPINVQNILLNLNPARLEMLSAFQQVPNLVILEQPYQSNQKLKFMIKLTQQLRELHPQAILVYPFGLHLFVGLAGRLAQVTSIATTAQNTLPEQPALQSQWQKIVWLSQLLRIPIHPCSEAVRQSFQDLVQLPKGSSLIANGCSVKAIASQAKASRQESLVDAPTIIGMVARLNCIKDHATLIKAFGIVHEKHPHTQLWLIGNGEERNTLEELTQELELDQSVIFWGNRDDVPSLLGKMDIYAFSTTANEGFGIAIIEAMAAGLPVIASDVPACREVLGNGQAGLLVPPDDSVSMSNILEELLLSAQKRLLWGQKSYQYVLEHYDIENCAKKWYGLLLQE